MTILLLLLAAPLDLGTREVGPIRVRLVIVVPAQGVAPGLAAVRLELEATGPDTMQIDGPRLEDALAAWGVRWAAASWSSGQRGWSAQLEQTKPGVARLPGVSVRVRESAEADWHDLAWHDPLGETLGVAPPAPLPEPSRQPPWLWLAAAAALFVRLAFLLMLRKPAPGPVATPLARALAALDMLAGTPAEQFDSLTAIVRRYGAEEPSHAPAFAEVLALSEKGRFAPVSPTQASLDQALALARRVFGELGQNAEIGKTA